MTVDTGFALLYIALRLVVYDAVGFDFMLFISLYHYGYSSFMFIAYLVY